MTSTSYNAHVSYVPEDLPRFLSFSKTNQVLSLEKIRKKMEIHLARMLLCNKIELQSYTIILTGEHVFLNWAGQNQPRGVFSSAGSSYC